MSSWIGVGGKSKSIVRATDGIISLKPVIPSDWSDSWLIFGIAAITVTVYTKRHPPGPTYTYAWLWLGLLAHLMGSEDGKVLFYIIGFGLLCGWYSIQIIFRDIWSRILIYWCDYFPEWCVSTIVRFGDVVIHVLPFLLSANAYSRVERRHLIQALLYERVYFLATEGSFLGDGRTLNTIYALRPPCEKQVFRTLQMLSTVGYFFAGSVCAPSSNQRIFLQALWSTVLCFITLNASALASGAPFYLIRQEWDYVTQQWVPYAWALISNKASVIEVTVRLNAIKEEWKKLPVDWGWNSSDWSAEWLTGDWKVPAEWKAAAEWRLPDEWRDSHRPVVKCLDELLKRLLGVKRAEDPIWESQGSSSPCESESTRQRGVRRSASTKSAPNLLRRDLSNRLSRFPKAPSSINRWRRPFFGDVWVPAKAARTKERICKIRETEDSVTKTPPSLRYRCPSHHRLGTRQNSGRNDDSTVICNASMECLPAKKRTVETGKASESGSSTVIESYDSEWDKSCREASGWEDEFTVPDCPGLRCRRESLSPGLVRRLKQLEAKLEELNSNVVGLCARISANGNVGD